MDSDDSRSSAENQCTKTNRLGAENSDCSSSNISDDESDGMAGLEAWDGDSDIRHSGRKSRGTQNCDDSSRTSADIRHSRKKRQGAQDYDHSSRTSAAVRTWNPLSRKDTVFETYGTDWYHWCGEFKKMKPYI